MHTIIIFKIKIVFSSLFVVFVVIRRAGVGRTGTFCTVHGTLERFANELNAGNQPSINILTSVLAMRHARPGMVQTKEQYIFCYLAVLEQTELWLHERGMLPPEEDSTPQQGQAAPQQQGQAVSQQGEAAPAAQESVSVTVEALDDDDDDGDQVPGDNDEATADQQGEAEEEEEEFDAAPQLDDDGIEL